MLLASSGCSDICGRVLKYAYLRRSVELNDRLAGDM